MARPCNLQNGIVNSANWFSFATPLETTTSNASRNIGFFPSFSALEWTIWISFIFNSDTTFLKNSTFFLFESKRQIFVSGFKIFIKSPGIPDPVPTSMIFKLVKFKFPRIL